MKLWRIPNEWDYHGLGAVFVIAPDEATAIKTAQERLIAEGRQDRDAEYSRGSAAHPSWEDIVEIPDAVWFQEGCDE